MPELPEVETIVRGLDGLLAAKVVAEVRVFHPGSFPDNPALTAVRLTGAVIRRVDRRGKAILIYLDNSRVLMVHLKMTGQLIYYGQETASRISEPLPGRSSRIAIHFIDGSVLYFNDQRKFGWMKLLAEEELTRQPFLQKLGVEPLSGAFTAGHLEQLLNRRKGSSVKAALLDQSIIAGIGNIYADESLFLSGIDPDRRCRDLTSEEVKRLHRAIRRVLRESIKMGGSTRRNYRNAIGQTGDYLTKAWVYGRTGEACRKCGRPIMKKRTAGRGTHYCPGCQS